MFGCFRRLIYYIFFSFFAESIETAGSRRGSNFVDRRVSRGPPVKFHDDSTSIFLLLSFVRSPVSTRTAFGIRYAFSSHAYSRDYRCCVISARFRAGYSHEADFRGRSRLVLGCAISPLVRHASANYVKILFFSSLR